MSLAVTLLCCGISFVLGLKVKTDYVQKLKKELLDFKTTQEGLLKKANYQIYLEKKDYDILQRQFENFKEEVKKKSFSKIIREEEKNLNPSLNFLSNL